MNLIHKMKDILFKDVSTENESKDLSVLMRILCIINVLFNIVLTVFYLAFLSSRLFQWSIAFIVIFGLIFWMTYWDRTNGALYVYTSAMIMSMLIYSFALGPTVGFQFSLYSLVLLFYYKTDENPIFKGIAAVIISISVIAIWFYLVYIDKVVEFTKLQNIILLLNCTIYLSCTFATVAYFYYLKFASSEHKIIKYAKKLEKLATMDPLTQLTNRRGMMNHLEAFVADSASHSQLSLAISDIDFFKKVNDTYGHDAGDYVLIELGKTFKEFMKDKGWIARWGGEEFLFAFENNNGDYAFEQLDKLKYSIEKKQFTYKDYTFNLTMTFGLEEYDSSIGITETIKSADNKLYQGKESGRNKIVY
ncbi:MAG: diguanylate cyclase [Lachnospiraceae bacterium]|nr:diguanylate cyclase [Lachnospiraceae bacterium]MBR5766601.1 diguanylate cyclase [Lachnospiraceae bacterium]MBR6470041.1 diguanylate cyclase [Lachnospiraceae bacterium]MBR6487040.1 diguanylate cyclase [Lachnospiraceae bacterium]